MGKPTIVNAYVQKVVEDGVKTGLAASGIGTATTLGAIVSHPLTLVATFVGGFGVSVVFSLISQPFGNPNSNHIFGEVPAAEAALGATIAAVSGQLAATQPQPAQQSTPAQPAQQQGPSGVESIVRLFQQGQPTENPQEHPQPAQNPVQAGEASNV